MLRLVSLTFLAALGIAAVGVIVAREVMSGGEAPTPPPEPSPKEIRDARFSAAHKALSAWIAEHPLRDFYRNAEGRKLLEQFLMCIQESRQDFPSPEQVRQTDILESTCVAMLIPPGGFPSSISRH